MFGIPNEKIIELRLRCLEPFVTVASKHGIEQDVVLKKAELAWEYAIKPLIESVQETPVKTTSKPNK